MAAFTSIATGNWDDGPNTWGTGAGVYPGSADASDTVVIADTHVVTLNVSPANYISTITNTGNAGYITCATDQTLLLKGNPGITYSGTSTSGFIRVTANTLTITHNQGAATVAVLASAAGYAIVTSVTGSVSIANTGGTALSSTSSGRALSSAGTGLIAITGNTNVSGTGYGVYAGSSSVSSTFAGSLVVSTAGIGFRMLSGTLTWTPGITGISVSGTAVALSGMYANGGTLTINAKLATVSTSNTTLVPLLVAGGTVNYVGDYTLADGEDCLIGVCAGTLNLATADDELVLTNNGSFVVIYQAGTLTTTSGAHVASVINNKTTSYAAIIGGTADNKAIISGPTLPAAGDVDATAADYGYAGALVDPTCVLPAEEDVETGVQYGAGGVEFTGTLVIAGFVGVYLALLGVGA